MDRRNFLKQSALFSAASFLLPGTLFSSCRKEELFQEIDYTGKTIIIGAGVAGLYAGLTLKLKGMDFTLLEATSNYGGRMGKLTGFADYTIDTGAQWMHGRNSVIGNLVTTTNTKITKDETELKYWFNKKITATLPKDPFIFEEKNLPDISFKEWAQQNNFGPEYNNIIEAIAGDQGASASLLSTYWNNKDEENWASGDDDFKFAESYFDLIDKHIAQPILPNIKFNCPIVSINYSGNNIVLTDSANNVHIADKVIITVPISILKLNEIAFIPPLPEEKQNAFSKFGMGPGMKVFLKFNSKFYEDLVYGGAICGAYVSDTLGKTTTNNILLAFVMGDQAAYLTSLGSDQAITTALLNELDELYNGQATPAFIDARIYNYTNKPYIKGAYGYSTVGMGNARKIAAEPIQNKLFFAGEAMNTNGHHQTVHGAAESGYKAVLDILKNVQK